MLKIKKTPEQLELMKAIGSKNQVESKAAQEAFAAAIGPVFSQVLLQMGTASLIYTDLPYGEDESPVFPLDFLADPSDNQANSVQVWSQNVAGGLPSTHIETSGELKFSTYALESAVHFGKKYARKTYAFNVMSKAIERMLNEILVKQERQAWAVILRLLGEASTGGTKHTIVSTTQNVLQLDDFNRLITLNKRLNQSYASGTPVGTVSRGATDIFLSPEMKEQIRGFAYQPMNTRAVPNTDESTAVPLPDAIREEIFRSAGDSSIYGVNITDLNELGTSQKYNILFANYATSGIAASSGNFSSTADELVVALDLSREGFYRAVKQGPDGNSTAEILSDDQWPLRADMLGFYCIVEEGRVCTNSKLVTGLII